ncbi:MAG: thioredoxin domain-containing protein [Campylobacterota bacterium]|nr:thioredoxin domain-containing protein [Campylobacterota bacterium]
MKRSLMLKSLMTISLLSTSIAANNNIDNKIISFENKRINSLIKRNPNVKLNDMKMVLKKDLNQDGWFGYAFDLKLEARGKNVSQKHYVFSNGKMLAPELINIDTKRSFKDQMYPSLSKKYFSKKHLIAGNPDAKHSLVIFSDPLCPICVDEVPMIMKNIIDNPKNIALYYYHMPLRMHPTASTLAKASMIASSMGIENVDYKLYDANAKYFYGEDKDVRYDPYKEKDHKKALDYFNWLFKTNITMKQINDKKWEDKLKYDMKMSDDAFVGGTPTLFFNGEVDKKRDKYEKFLK